VAAHWLLCWGNRPQSGARPGARRRLGLKQTSQDAVEYALILATLALVVLLGTGAFGSLVEVWFAALIRVVTGR
jgi:Flp pilus assembly pilin Flp